MAFTYRNPRTLETWSFDAARPDLVANGWALISDTLDAAAIAAVANLNARRAGEQQLSDLLAAARANAVAAAAAAIGKDLPGGVAGLDSLGHVLAAELANAPGVRTVYSARITSGDVNCTSGAFAQVGPDLTIAAAAGNVLMLRPGVLALAGADMAFDATTRIAGADNRWWSTAGGAVSAWPGALSEWYVLGSSPAGPGPGLYVVNADDVDGSGNVTVRFYGRSTGATRTVKGDANYATRLWLSNLG